MKIMEYASITKLTSDNVFLVDGTNGTKKIITSDALLSMLDLISPKNKRLIFRGKNLGASFTSEQKSAVQSGTFEGLCLGDYWVINGVNWRIVDFDYWYKKGTPNFSTHHLVIMPDTSLITDQMNASATTTGGYTGSTMYTANMAPAKSEVTSAFGDAVLTYKDYLINTVANGYPSAGSFVDASIELPNEPMIYGSYIYTPANNGSTDVKRYTINTNQLALFQVAPEFITAGSGYWLRDVASSTQFCRVDSSGAAQASNASVSTVGVRPVFPIG